MDTCQLNKHNLWVNYQWWDISFRVFFFVLINKAGFTTNSWFCQLRIIVVTEGAVVNGVTLPPKGSSWLECVRGVTGSSIIRHIHKCTLAHRKTPLYLNKRGKCEGDD